MMSLINEGWIENKFYYEIGYIKAKDCDFNKDNFKNEFEKEAMDKIELLTDVQEGYFRCVKSGFWEKSEFGDYCYKPCSKGKGATLYYFAGIKLGG